MLPLQTTIGWVGPKNNYWEWIRDHLPNVQNVPAEDAIVWKSRQQGVLAVALESRQDSRLALIEQLQPSSGVQSSGSLTASSASRSKPKSKRMTDKELSPKSESPWFVVLGEEWAGHRRTQPLAEGIVSFYWYELFDQVFPWLSAIHSDAVHLSVRRVDRIMDAASRSTAPGVSDTFALIRTDNATDSELWSDSLAQIGVLSLDLPWNGRGARISPDVIIVDLEERPRASLGQPNERMVRCIEEWSDLQNRFPHAMRVAVDSFPRWTDWKQLVEIGIDVLLPKPFSTFGLQWALQQWQQPGSSLDG